MADFRRDEKPKEPLSYFEIFFTSRKIGYQVKIGFCSRSAFFNTLLARRTFLDRIRQLLFVITSLHALAKFEYFLAFRMDVNFCLKSSRTSSMQRGRKFLKGLEEARQNDL